MAEINENWIQFQGKFIVPEAPNRESYVLVSGEFEHGDMVEKNNQDGTVDRIFKIEPLRIQIQNGDQRLIGKVKRRASQRLRGALWHEYQKTDLSEELFEDYYENYVSKLIAYLPEVSNFLDNR